MAGHSKWANIKHRKGAQDAKRAKLFAKLSKEITVAAMQGLPDPEANASLRLAIGKARAQSMPKKNIENAIDKAKGNAHKDSFKELTYGANISGVSFLIQCLTDNVNRTTSAVQHLVSKMNGSIAGASSVNYIFHRKGVLEVPKCNHDEDQLMMSALEMGAEDFEAGEQSFFIYTKAQDFSEVKSQLEKSGINNFKTAEVQYLPNQEQKVTPSRAEKILNFIDQLEDNDDVQAVFHNLDADSLLEV